MIINFKVLSNPVKYKKIYGLLIKVMRGYVKCEKYNVSSWPFGCRTDAENKHINYLFIVFVSHRSTYLYHPILFARSNYATILCI